MGKKKKKKKKGKKRGMLATLANAVLNPHDATRGMSSDAKLAGGIELAQDHAPDDRERRERDLHREERRMDRGRERGGW